VADAERGGVDGATTAGWAGAGAGAAEGGAARSALGDTGLGTTASSSASSGLGGSSHAVRHVCPNIKKKKHGKQQVDTTPYITRSPQL
jgi:hypothetical protein